MMKIKSHTPGPWNVDLERDFTLGGDVVIVEAISPDGKFVTREICTLMLDTDEHPDGPEWLEDCANARLIAAAPELLAACKAARSFGSHGETHEGVSVSYLLDSAIAKADLRAKGE